jgi:small subunit ribosomal protein S16
MVKIRLRRMGSTHRPFYRLVVSDSRRVPTSSAIEEVGYYDPRQEPAVLEVNQERVEHWVGRGAQLSPTVKKLVRQARNGGQAQPEKPAKPTPPAQTEQTEPAEQAAQA